MRNVKITKALMLGCILYLFSITDIYAQQAGWVTLRGKLKGYTNQVEIEDWSEYQYLSSPSPDRIIIPDSNGNFIIRFKISAPNYYCINWNHQLYLTPGDDMEVFMDQYKPENSTFKGKGAEANNYLRNTPYPKNGSYLQTGREVKSTADETFLNIENLAKLRSKELDSVTNVSPEFIRLERARIKADLINSYRYGAIYIPFVLKMNLAEMKKYDEGYNKIIAPRIKVLCQNFTDASYMKLLVYRENAQDIIKEGGRPSDVQVIKDWETASNLVNKMRETNDKQLLATFNTRIDSIQTQAYRDAARHMLNRLSSFGKGDAAADFTATNIHGEKVSLSSLKGKVIYVDMWATWCGPCMQEMPHFEELKKKYSDNPNVVFVSLSIDEETTRWQNSVKQREAEGYQWHINLTQLHAYNMMGVPRALLIDKDFKMIDVYAPMPSEESTTKIIDSLLK